MIYGATSVNSPYDRTQHYGSEAKGNYMAQINIRRGDDDKVTFDTVYVDTTETVFFTNLDDQSAHWPDIAANQVGPCKSPNSSNCVVRLAAGAAPPGQTTYKCKITGHENESGSIFVVLPLAVGKDAKNGTVTSKPSGQPISPALQVVQAGLPPYKINRQVFQFTDKNGNVSSSTNGLQLNNTATQWNDPTGITLSGTPANPGTLVFALDVSDKRGGNLQQQYTMTIT